ncbi:Rgp1-domain-containing protein [Cantharellus anzutake]|uniref:Rgp1-domain-containing protein n=1 Tax=Cantharellus anzutake TaxID=1750568 RepID=UPI00190496D5|nr:Rgp1-domain-containing protein [Cantharellus anzutake]KAF8330350.1 Rgp1-domain-containing protein [Cantharellus anzutake]
MSDGSDGIQVNVVPTQSSYFAGETFQVTITFSNVNTQSSPDIHPRPGVSPATLGRSHRRAAHSVANFLPIIPPSPRVSPYLTSDLNAKPISAVKIPRPHRRVGKCKRADAKCETNYSAITPSDDHTLNDKSRHNSRSLSLSSMQSQNLPTSARDRARPELDIHPSPLVTKKIIEPSSIPSPSPHNSPHPSTSYDRPSSFSVLSRPNAQSSIPLHHPHARKQSVTDSLPELQETQAVSAQSGFTQSLDTISEVGSTQASPSKNGLAAAPALNSSGRSFARQGPKGQATNIPPRLRGDGIDHRRPPPRSASAAASTFSSLSHMFQAPGQQTLLWAYAQLVGTFELEPTLVPAHEADVLRAHLRAGMALGGGRMDIDNANQSPYTFGFLPSLFSSAPSISSTPGSTDLQGTALLVSPTSPRFGSSLFSFFSPNPHSSAFGFSTRSPSSGNSLGDASSASGYRSHMPLPTLETQPTVLVVDLQLDPGQSRSYTYSLPLPSALPPTYRGRAFRFSYTLIIGTSRSSSGSYSISTASLPIFPFSSADQLNKQRSKVVRIPVRIYNHVAVGRVPRPYDLLWPVARRRETRTLISSAAFVEEITKESPLHSSSHHGWIRDGTPSSLSRTRVESYAAALLRGDVRKASLSVMPRLSTDSSGTGEAMEHENEFSSSLEKYSCRQVVEVMTRNPKKVSYDIAKDGEDVAVLTFVKSAYRVGETILGILDINLAPGHARVLKLSAALEAQETLPSPIQTHAFSRNSHRRTHSEYALSFAMNTHRASFSLDIPADATPAFGFIAPPSPHQEAGDVDAPPTKGGVEWKIRLCFLVAVLPSKTYDTGRNLGRLRKAAKRPKSEMTSSTGTTVQESDCEDPTRFRIPMHSLLPDEPSSEWATSWSIGESLAPLRFVEDELENARVGGWMSMIMGTGSDGGNSVVEPDGIAEAETKGIWKETKLDVLECEVPVMVWPGATAFQPVETSFNA